MAKILLLIMDGNSSIASESFKGRRAVSWCTKIENVAQHSQPLLNVVSNSKSQKVYFPIIALVSFFNSFVNFGSTLFNIISWC